MQNMVCYTVGMLYDDGHSKDENAPDSEAKPLTLDQGLRILAHLITRRYLEHQVSKREFNQRSNYGDNGEQR